MPDRIAQIQKNVNSKGEITFKELCNMFPDVSGMTIRRDLAKLENKGEVILARGSIKSVKYISRLREEQVSKRAFENVAEKKLIAQKAFGMIRSDTAVFLDSGTTVAELANLFTDEKLVVVTASPEIAIECAKNPNTTVYMTGGRLSRDNLSLSGAGANGFLDDINIDMAFMATSGYSVQNAFSCGNYDECRLKATAIARAGKTFLLMDSSKIGKSMPFTFARFKEIDCIITDGLATSEFIRAAGSSGVEII